MDRLYAFGVTFISAVQFGLADFDWYFKLVNIISDPQHLIDYWFPIVSIVDSSFAAQLLLCMGFGGWLISILKWWLLEDRPYWWVQNTNYYTREQRPLLQQTCQTCETGPGSPSGHTASAAMALLLIFMWFTHYMNDRKVYYDWWKYVVYSLYTFVITSVMLARMFVAAHFPHQCLLGALIGSLLAPTLCVYVSDPFLWQYGAIIKYDPKMVKFWHIISTIVTTLITVVTYYSMKLCGWEPSWSVKLAYRYCDNPDTIRRSSMPLSSLMHCTASLLGWAAFVNPSVSKYRYYTKNRSLIVAIIVAGLFIKMNQMFDYVALRLEIKAYYLFEFFVTFIRPAIFLRLLPLAAQFPYYCVCCYEKLNEMRQKA